MVGGSTAGEQDGGLGSQMKGITEIRYGLIQKVQALIGSPAVDLGVQRRSVSMDRLCIIVHRQGQLSGLRKDHATVHVGRCAFRIQFYGPVQVSHRQFQLASEQVCGTAISVSQNVIGI